MKVIAPPVKYKLSTPDGPNCSVTIANKSGYCWRKSCICSIASTLSVSGGPSFKMIFNKKSIIRSSEGIKSAGRIIKVAKKVPKLIDPLQ